MPGYNVIVYNDTHC